MHTLHSNPLGGGILILNLGKHFFFYLRACFLKLDTWKPEQSTGETRNWTWTQWSRKDGRWPILCHAAPKSTSLLISNPVCGWLPVPSTTVTQVISLILFTLSANAAPQGSEGIVAFLTFKPRLEPRSSERAFSFFLMWLLVLKYFDWLTL